jgi:hypothetical protein
VLPVRVLYASGDGDGDSAIARDPRLHPTMLVDVDQLAIGLEQASVTLRSIPGVPPDRREALVDAVTAVRTMTALCQRTGQVTITALPTR